MPRKSKKSAPHPAGPAPGEPSKPLGLRIIGGHYRGRKLKYTGDERTRPMKDRVRQAVFDLLGPDVVGKQAVDLFAGTGALGLEAVSRGAVRAVLVERHHPTAVLIRENAESLGLEPAQAEVVSQSAFVWVRKQKLAAAPPWVVFISPPYDFYVSQAASMLDLVERLLKAAPAESLFALEADERFDFGQLPEADAWDVRAKPPAYVGIYRKPPASTQGQGE